MLTWEYDCVLISKRVKRGLTNTAFPMGSINMTHGVHVTCNGLTNYRE